mgnify:CR=1 FL=1
MDSIHITIRNEKTIVTYKDNNNIVTWVAIANSGQGEGMNNPSMSGIPFQGPIIKGKYYIDLPDNGAPDPERNATADEAWGLYAWELKETSLTRLKRNIIYNDRDGGFYLHQDKYGRNSEGTSGCVGILGYHKMEELKLLLEKFSIKNNKIDVTVDY